MILLYLILLPFVAGIIGMIVAPRSRVWARAIMVAFMAVTGVLVAIVAITAAGQIGSRAQAPVLSYVVQLNATWIPQLGISFHLGADGLTLLMLGLTVVLGIVALLSSFNDARENDGLYLFNIGLVIAGVTGVFLSADLILFFLFWELMIVPMYFMISIWGGTEKRQQAAIKFFLFTQASGLLMLLAMLGLYIAHGSATGTYTFDVVALSAWASSGAIPAGIPMVLIFAGFLAAFGVKLAVVPFHSWAPDAYAEAPTAGSILLSGLLLKSGAYGLLRFSSAFFAAEVKTLAPLFMVLGVITILYGSILAIRQDDLKRIVAYSSIGHMGFVILGLFSWNSLGYSGAIIIMMSHGFTTSALFLISGAVGDRLKTRDIMQMGGMRAVAPRLAGFGTAFWVFALGLPGSGNFLGEFLVLAGTFRVSVLAAVLGAVGSIFSLVYALRAIHRMFDGPRIVPESVPDFNVRESIVTGALVVLVLWVGLMPATILSAARSAAPNVPEATGTMINTTGGGNG